MTRKKPRCPFCAEVGIDTIADPTWHSREISEICYSHSVTGLPPVKKTKAVKAKKSQNEKINTQPKEVTKIRTQANTKMMEIWKWINDGLADSETGLSVEFGHLKSFQQDKAKHATAVLNEAMNYAMANDFYGLNIEKSGVANSFFASVSKDGKKAAELDLAGQPTSRALGKYEPDQFPRPVMVTVESATSHAVAIVLVTFEAVTFAGFGEWGSVEQRNQPEMEVLGVYGNQAYADEALREIANAYRTLEQVADLVHDYAERRAGGEPDNGTAKGAF